MQEKIKLFAKDNWLLITGVILGAITGYLYWHQVGCSSGTCAITSSPINSTLYGCLLGGSFASLFKKEKKNKTE